ncbi:MAG TPA: hypothetical protein VGM78_02945, partial [Ilumatobacteraceae bacterium]
ALALVVERFIDRRPRGDGVWVILLLWTAMATVAFLTGGQFHRHYWVTLCPCISGLAAVLVTRWLRPRYAVALAVLALLPSIDSSIRILTLSNERAPIIASDDGRLTVDQTVAAWFDSVRQPGDQLYVMCASAAVYADAHADPPYPYLWEDGVLTARGAQEQLRALLAKPDGPRYVALFQLPNQCDASPATQTELGLNYAPLVRIGGVQVMERVSRTS